MGRSPCFSFRCLDRQLPNLGFPGPSERPYEVFLDFPPVDSLLVVASRCRPSPPFLQPLPSPSFYRGFSCKTHAGY